MPLFAEIKDDFEDGVIDAVKWEGSSGTIRETGGRAGILSDTGFPALRTPATYSLIGSSVFARPYPAPAGTSTGSATSEMLIDSPTGGTRLIIIVNSVTNEIHFRSDVGYGDAAGVTLVYSATEHAWWRFREATGTVYMETSPDASTWTIRRQVATPDWITAGNNPLFFSTHREDGALTHYFEVDNVNLVPVVATAPATPINLAITPSDTSAIVSWTASDGATDYDIEYRKVSEDTSVPDQTVAPWSTVTLTAPVGHSWSQSSGKAVAFSGTGETVSFVAPPSMSSQNLVFSYGSGSITVAVGRAKTGVKQADGTFKPVRNRRLI